MAQTQGCLGLPLLIECTPSLLWSDTMPKERNSRKEEKKKPTMTPKEKKAAKQAKKASKGG
jgi:hypothetical protein